MRGNHSVLNAFKHWALAGNKKERDSGQSVIILAIGLVALLGFAGLVFDGGTAYAQFRRMQNAADAGALAGATELTKKDATNTQNVCNVVNNYAASLNGTPVYGGQTAAKVKIQWILKNNDLVTIQDPDNGLNCGTGPVHPNAVGVRATVSTQVNTFFLKLFGNPTGTITAHASAEYGPAQAITAQPLAKRCNDLTPGHNCGLHKGDPPEEIWESNLPGNFGWLSWNGDNDAGYLEQMLQLNFKMSDYEDDVTGCKALEPGCWVQGDPGVKSSSGVRAALDAWIASGRPMIIILYDREEERGSHSDYRIVGFAAFYIESYDLNSKEIWGTFDTWVTAAQINKDALDTGFYSVHLIPDIVEPAPPPPANGRICVAVANDLGGDGTYDPLVDYYVQNATIHVYDSGGSQVASWQTYGISANCIEVPPGNYRVTEDNPTSPVPLPSNSYTDPAAAGFHLGSSGIQDILFLDYSPTNTNLIVTALDADNGNAAFPGASITVRDVANNIAGSATTSITGTAFFRYLPIGSYTVSASAINHDATPASSNLNLTLGVTGTLTFSMHDVPSGNLDVHVFDDANNPLINVQINIVGPGLNTTRYTDGTGFVHMVGVPVGSYSVTEVNLPGYESLTPDTVSKTVTVGGTVQADFQDRVPPKGTICVLVFDDTTGDGNWSGGEMLATGATVNIRDSANNLVGTWITNGSEPHCYPNLPVGTYSVVETNASGWYSTNPDSRSVGVTKDATANVQFGDRMATPTPVTATRTPTKTPTSSRTPTPTKTNTPPPNTTPTPTATPTSTPVPGALCVTVFQDRNSNGLFDTTPPPPPPAPTPAPTFTPEVLLAPQSVTILNSVGASVGSWDGAGAQPHCFNGLWPGAYTALETNPAGYGSTTADSVTAPVQSSQSTQVLFGDMLCLPQTPVMGNVTVDAAGDYWLHWQNVGALSYRIMGSFTSQTVGVGEWHEVATVAVVNYRVVEAENGTFYYVVAINACGSSGASNVVALP